MKRKSAKASATEDREQLTARVSKLLVSFAKHMLTREVRAPDVAGHIAENIVETAFVRSAEQKRLVDEISLELGPRKFRLLLAACCRHAIRRDRQGYSWKDEAEALAVLEHFADTGKSKTALRDSWRKFNRTQNNCCHVLHLALSPTEPEAALLPCVGAIRATFQVSEEEAWKQLRRFQHDLTSPLSHPSEFVDDWRAPSVVELARTIYESSDFNAMPRLAEALEQAGCDHQTVLDHCRDTGVPHIRGCWVLDAILQDWVQKRPSPRKPNKVLAEARRKKTPLSKVTKRGKENIVRIMEERDGNLPLEEFLAKRWDVAGFRRSPSRSEEDAAKLLLKWQSQYSKLHPSWTPDQIQTVMSFAALTEDLRDAAVARRFALDDPGELGRGLAVLYRLKRIQKTWQGHAITGLDYFIEACAVGDVPMVQAMVDGARAGYTAIPTDNHLIDIAEFAILQKDFDTLGLVTQQLAKRKAYPEMLPIFTGLLERCPDQVAAGLGTLLAEAKRRRIHDEFAAAVMPSAHGLYRLCEWVSPELVSEFDVLHPMPWDADFHEWCQNHPDPLAGVDLSGVSPMLHQAVVLGNPPAWLTPPPMKAYEVVLHGGDPESPEVLERVGYCAGTGGAPREAKEVLKRCPVVLRWNLPLDFAEKERQALEELGASAEVRPTERTPFRFHIS